MPLLETASALNDDTWLIEARAVRKKYCRNLERSLWYGVRDVVDALTLRAGAPEVLREDEFWSLDGVSFTLHRGESLGILGANGAGKSTLLKLVSGQRAPTSGAIRTRGRIVALTELGLGFDPVLTGRENAYINAAVHGIGRAAFAPILEDVIDFSGIRDFIDAAVQTYSSGMKARLGFAVATHLDPDILIVDEVLSVGDLDFKRKCIQHILAYLRRGGSVLLVSHEPFLIQSVCNRALVLERGKVVFAGSAVDGVDFHFRQAQQPLPAVREGEPLAGLFEEDRLVVIDRITVEDDAGATPRTGLPCLIRYHYRSKVRAEVVWGFTLCTSDLQTNIASCNRGLDGDHAWIEAGAHALTCRLPALPLQPGLYGLRGGIAEADSHAALTTRGFDDRPHFFEVAPAGVSRSNNLKLVRNDLITIHAEWP